MSTPPMLPHDWFPRPMPSNVFLGERSWCYSSFSCVHYRSRRPWGVRVGHDTGIYDGTFFDLGPEGEVEIGSFCTLVGAIVCTNGRVVIRDYAFLAHEVVLAESFAAVPGRQTVRTGQDGRECATRTLIDVGVNSWIGAQAVLLAGARIGEGAIVGAAAVINFDVPPYAVVAGCPARIVGWSRPSGDQAA